MKLFDPTAPPAARALRVAPRPGHLAGLRLGLVENTKFNSDTLLLELGERLARGQAMTVAHLHRKRSPSHEIDAAAVAILQRQADLVISGIGD